MRYALVVVLALAMGGCWLDAFFVNPETRQALKEADLAKKEADAARAQLEAAKTDAEKAEAEARVLAATARLEKAKKTLEEAVESKAPSPSEMVAGIVGNWLPWLSTALLGLTAAYKHKRVQQATGRAEQGEMARKAVLETVEKMGDTDEGKKLKKSLSGAFEKHGVTDYIDTGLRLLGFLRKSTA